MLVLVFLLYHVILHLLDSSCERILIFGYCGVCSGFFIGLFNNIVYQCELIIHQMQLKHTNMDISCNLLSVVVLKDV